MKQILFALFLLSALTVSVQAQTPACCAGKKSASCQAKVADASTSIPADYLTAAAKMASLDPTIEPRTNPVTGEVSYVRKQTCHDGAVSYVALNFDPATSTFVNVSPSQVEQESKGAGCAPKNTSASGKSCCAAGAASKSCCADKMKSSAASSNTSTNTSATPAKTVSNKK